MKNILLNVSAIFGSIGIYNVILYGIVNAPVNLSAAIVAVFLIFLGVGKTYPAFYQLLPFAPINSIYCYAVSIFILICNHTLYSYYRFISLTQTRAVNTERLLQSFLYYGLWSIVWMTFVFFGIKVVMSTEKDSGSKYFFLTKLALLKGRRVLLGW